MFNEPQPSAAEPNKPHPEDVREVWYSLPQASAHTGYEVSTLRWRRANNLPPISRKRAGRVVYSKLELDAWLESELAGAVRGAPAESLAN